MRAIAAIGGVVVLGLVWWLVVQGDGTDGAAPPDFGLGGARHGGAEPTEQREPPPRVRSAPFNRPPTVRSKKDAAQSSTGDAVLRGRCVDAETGEPLAGCTVKLHGWTANRRRMDEYVANHGEVVWEDPPVQVTEASGGFEFRILPPPPFQFTLDITTDGRAGVSGRWSKLEPGATTDFGDVKMWKGARVTGSILDTAGLPQGRVRVSMMLQWEGRRSSLGPRIRHYTRSRSDGAIAFNDFFLPGTWRISVQARETLGPDTVEIGEGATRLDITTIPESEIPSITGNVVDDAGHPVRARIHVPRGSRSWTTVSDADGKFVLKRRSPDRVGLPEPPTDPNGLFFVHAQQDGFEEGRTDKPVSWGTSGVRIVLRRGCPVEVRVLDGDTGQPVESFGIRCFPDPRHSSRISSKDYRLRDSGQHPGGVLTIGALLRGPRLMTVEPKNREYLPSRLKAFTVTDVGASSQEIVVFRSVRRTLRVVRPDGSPVVGTKVDLVRRWNDNVVTAQTRAVDLRRAPGLGRSTVLLIQEGNTDEFGTLELVGPPREDLMVRVFGPGHPALAVPDVRLDAGSGNLEVIVGEGAILTGQIHPPEFVRQLQPTSEGPTAGEHYGPGVALCVPGTREQVFPPGRDSFAVEADGSFRLVGAPPGSWEVRLQYWTNVSKGSAASTSFAIGSALGLKDGQTRHIEIDLSDYVQATLDGQVLLDGGPATGVRIMVRGIGRDPQGKERTFIAQGIRTDEAGRFTTALWPGEHRLVAEVGRDLPRIRISDARTLHAAPGDKLKATFDLRTGTLKFRVLGSDGTTPVEGIRLRIRLPRPESPIWSGLTDNQGRVDQKWVPAALVDVLVWPKHLSTPKAQQGIATRQERDAALIRVKSISVPVGESSVDIVLPSSTGY